MPLKRSTSQEARIYAVLEEGPATAPEVATSLSMDRKLTSAHLNNMRARGVVQVSPGRRADVCPECGHRASGRAPQIYSLVNGRPR